MIFTRHNSVRQLTFIVASVLFTLAMVIGGVALRPASANSRGTSELPSTNHVCTSSSPCQQWTNTGTGNAIKVVAQNGAGVMAVSNAPTGAGMYAHNGSLHGYGIIVDSNAGDAIKSVVGGGGRGLDAFGGGPGGIPAIAATAFQPNVDLIDGYNHSSVRVAELDDAGNLHLAGKVFTSGSCSAGCISERMANGQELTAYASAQTVPSVEDFGKGEIVNGRGYVRLATDFGRVIDPRAEYLVFLTPEGDNRGLYITGKSMAGFMVRESQGGRGSLSFDYRIVAKPFASREARLPLWSAKSWQTTAPVLR